MMMMMMMMMMYPPHALLYVPHELRIPLHTVPFSWLSIVQLCQCPLQANAFPHAQHNQHVRGCRNQHAEAACTDMRDGVHTIPSMGALARHSGDLNSSLVGSYVTQLSPASSARHACLMRCPLITAQQLTSKHTTTSFQQCVMACVHAAAAGVKACCLAAVAVRDLPPEHTCCLSMHSFLGRTPLLWMHSCPQPAPARTAAPNKQQHNPMYNCLAHADGCNA
ncbi:hypothetical protein COO60DRAFT_319757 [Scenedesmus sp. NREL 46B-D3]|nr:hypothetical protein COO60DRAFT_319757 [Scenedesmus sp. NREL 46B-D3]